MWQLERGEERDRPGIGIGIGKNRNETLHITSAKEKDKMSTDNRIMESRAENRGERRTKDKVGAVLFFTHATSSETRDESRGSRALGALRSP